MDSDLLFIEQCSKKKKLIFAEWNRLAQCAINSDYDVRYDLCELLYHFECIESERILLVLLNDEDRLIRASACEALHFSRSEDTHSLLCKSLTDKDKIVRAYAALSIGDIRCHISTDFNKSVEILKTYWNKEKNSWCKIAFARSLILLGELQYFDYLLTMIQNRFYKNRSFALNLIIELIVRYHIDVDKKHLTETLNKRRQVETVICVKNSIDELFELLIC